MHSWKRKYDIHNNMIEEIKYDQSGSVMNKETYQYNDEGRFIVSYSEIEYTEEGKEDLWRADNEYDDLDEQGNWTTSRSCSIKNFCVVKNRVFEYY